MVTVGGLAVKKLGYRKGFQVIRIVTQWALCWQSLGRAPSVSEYVAWAKESAGFGEATSFRDLALFREVFVKCTDPTPVVAIARRRIGRAGPSEGAAIVAGLPVREVV